MSPTNQSAAAVADDVITSLSDVSKPSTGDQSHRSHDSVKKEDVRHGRFHAPKGGPKKSLILLIVIAVAIALFVLNQIKNGNVVSGKKTDRGSVSELNMLLPVRSPSPSAEIPAAAKAATAKPQIPLDPPVLHSEFDVMKASLDEINNSIAALMDGLRESNADIEALREEQKKLARSVARNWAVTARAKDKQVATPAPINTATVLSVDSWNGRQSVSVSQGGQIKFINQGDSIGGFVLKGADLTKQQVEFSTPDGRTSKIPASGGGQ